MPIRCRRGTSWTTAPSASSRIVVVPSVRSHWSAQPARSCPLARDQHPTRSSSVALAEGEPGQVVAQPLPQRVVADQRGEGADDAGALHVQDAERLVPALRGRAYRRRHRLPARQLVRLISHRLVGVSEPGPRQRFADPGDRGQRGVGQVGGDRLVEPHVIPPPRPHQGAEPQVCHLMRADHRAVLVAGSVRPPEYLLVHHHQAGDRQRRGGQVRYEHDVVRGVGARYAEAAGVPGDGIAGIAGEPGQGSHRRLAK